MRLIVPTFLAALTLALGVAIANGASNLVTTLIAIPLGSIAGFAATWRLFDALAARRAQRRRERRRRPAQPILLVPIRQAPANDNVRMPPALPAPAIAA